MFLQDTKRHFVFRGKVTVARFACRFLPLLPHFRTLTKYYNRLLLWAWENPSATAAGGRGPRGKRHKEV